jgi:hypothetical protein
MDTIYSKIIWEELELKDYKIHKEPWERTEKLILDWIRENPLEKVEEVLFDLSWIRKITYETYYDGPFYGFSQHSDEVLDKLDGYKSDVVIHDCGMLPSILEMAIRTRMSPSDFRFIAQILEEFWKKVPKKESCTTESCSIDSGNWGYKVEPGKEPNESGDPGLNETEST